MPSGRKPTQHVIPLCLLLTAAAFAGFKSDIEFAKAGPVPRRHRRAWRRMKPLFEPLTTAGFAWFTINYRLAPAYHFPAPVEDVESAIRYVKSHAGEYKVDLKRIAITGSAGRVPHVSTTSRTTASKW